MQHELEAEVFRGRGEGPVVGGGAQAARGNRQGRERARFLEGGRDVVVPVAHDDLAARRDAEGGEPPRQVRRVFVHRFPD